MKKSDIIFEKLSEAIVLAEPSDPSSLLGLQMLIEEMGLWARENKQPKIEAAATAISNLLMRGIREELTDPKASMEVIEKAVSLFQKVINKGIGADTIDFPFELGLSEKNDKSDNYLNEMPEKIYQETNEETANPLEGDLSLLGDFVNEAKEHLEKTDIHLLTIETDPENEEALNAVFRAFHTIKGTAGFLALNEIVSLSHEAENLLDQARKGTLLLTGSALDITFDAVDALKRLVYNLRDSLETGKPLCSLDSLQNIIACIREAASGNSCETHETAIVKEIIPGMKLGEILVATGKITDESIKEALVNQLNRPDTAKLGEHLVRKNEIGAKDVAHALRLQKSENANKVVKIKETVKVDAECLDRLIETIGELVIVESMISQLVKSGNGMIGNISAQINRLDKITREIQELGTSLRMVPIGPTFQKMARLVRDLAKKSGKQVDFSMSGEETEIDKSVVDSINDPLVHMVRNSIDHGIEDNSEERCMAGKSSTGHIKLRAFHEGGNINIEIEDDGRGLDRARILAKARERSLIHDSESISDKDAFNLIFLPGFSTAEKVTSISGRGVGMDVVKRNIESLRGLIEIKSEKGKGSVFTIRLPLTLAIIDGMVIRVGKEKFIMPTLSIVRSIRPRKTEITTVEGRGEMLYVKGSIIPIFRLSSLYNINGAIEDPTKAIVVIVENGSGQIGFVTDELLGQQQIVIKSLGDKLKGIPGISGGAIMPDGNVGLILDIGSLIKLASERSIKNTTVTV